ncbi:ABC transporter permease [Labrys monachus]|uniref:Ribose/xylose/arabinose/galactoside ABC-type transport system permease subunit n=1 Tax=Labrys monachus TaxID=217067 RepID=A0ABU0FIN7_9HYPH|nr:ABC transporter permease [Labrys monachus]MDQ0394371.1 ribose/xylose/arabinose/galactoside ABC-type transport system permease subunit [Labrys monachus]
MEAKAYQATKPDRAAARPSGLDLRARRFAVWAVRYGTFIGLVIWLVAMSFSSDYFLTGLNLLNVAKQTSPIIVMGVGATFVMATGGIDLSVGSIVALVSCLATAWLADGVPPGLAILGVLGVGAGLGVINGFLVRLGIPPFIATLAGLVSIRGLAFVYSNGYAKPITDPFVLWIGRGSLAGVDVPILIAAVVAAVGMFALNRTQFGIHALALGGREEAARVMGLPNGRLKILVYAISGGLAALGGIIVAARLSNGSPNAGIGLELDVISAVVLGGTSLFGGSATVLGTIVGALFISFIRNGLNLLDVNPYWVQVVTGIVLVAAVLLNTIMNKRVEQWARISASDE